MARKRLNNGPSKFEDGVRNTTCIIYDTRIPESWEWWVWENTAQGITGLIVSPPNTPVSEVGYQKITFNTSTGKRRAKRPKTRTIYDAQGVFRLQGTQVVAGPFGSVTEGIEHLELEHGAPSEEEEPQPEQEHVEEKSADGYRIVSIS